RIRRSRTPPKRRSPRVPAWLRRRCSAVCCDVVPAKAGSHRASHHGLWNMGPQHKRVYARLPTRYARGRHHRRRTRGRLMAELKPKTVTRRQGNNQALKDGAVKPRTFAFDFEEVDPLIAAFRRMVRGNEFDICEMAITTYICAKAHGKPMTAVPVFLV